MIVRVIILSTIDLLETDLITNPVWLYNKAGLLLIAVLTHPCTRPKLTPTPLLHPHLLPHSYVEDFLGTCIWMSESCDKQGLNTTPKTENQLTLK